mmetsp:Transcript_38467/g.104195  ORF Transcript_38467/g.104195 Transcript_38467/m.104195 type:complete len:217 (+) Transcript_38467:347-997(+)
MLADEAHEPRASPVGHADAEGPRALDARSAASLCEQPPPLLEVPAELHQGRAAAAAAAAAPARPHLARGGLGEALRKPLPTATAAPVQALDGQSAVGHHEADLLRLRQPTPEAVSAPRVPIAAGPPVRLRRPGGADGAQEAFLASQSDQDTLQLGIGYAFTTIRQINCFDPAKCLQKSLANPRAQRGSHHNVCDLHQRHRREADTDCARCHLCSLG